MKQLTISTDHDARKAGALIVRHTARITATLAVALQTMHDQTAGYPRRASGAASTGGGGGMTVTIEDDTIPVTGVELSAIFASEGDPAGQDLATVYRGLAEAELVLNQLAELVSRYYTGRVNRSAVVDTVSEVYCPNCAVHGHFIGRAANRQHCWWCDSYRRANGYLPDAELIAKHHQGRRVLDEDLRAARARHEARTAAHRRTSRDR